MAWKMPFWVGHGEVLWAHLFREGQGDWPREEGDESSHGRLRGIERSRAFQREWFRFDPSFMNLCEGWTYFYHLRTKWGGLPTSTRDLPGVKIVRTAWAGLPSDTQDLRGAQNVTGVHKVHRSLCNSSPTPYLITSFTWNFWRKRAYFY